MYGHCFLDFVVFPSYHVLQHTRQRVEEVLTHKPDLQDVSLRHATWDGSNESALLTGHHILTMSLLFSCAITLGLFVVQGSRVLTMVRMTLSVPGPCKYLLRDSQNLDGTVRNLGCRVRLIFNCVSHRLFVTTRPNTLSYATFVSHQIRNG